jgi:hypothetical protein
MNRTHVVTAFLWLATLVLPQFSAAQDDKVMKRSASRAPFGITEASTIDALMPTIEGVGGSARELLQQQNVKSYMMPVRKVGARGTELSYMLATCLEYYVNLDKNYKLNLSPDYITLSIETNGKRATPLEAFTFLSQNGTVNAAIIPYDAPGITEAVYSAQKFKISNYLHLFREVTPARQRVFEVRKALMRGNPVLIEVKANESLRSATGRNWQPTGEASKTYPLVVVGYDETQQALEVLSCWGRTWGTNGYLWMSYDDFGKYAVNGYVLVSEL